MKLQTITMHFPFLISWSVQGSKMPASVSNMKYEGNQTKLKSIWFILLDFIIILMIIDCHLVLGNQTLKSHWLLLRGSWPYMILSEFLYYLLARTHGWCFLFSVLFLSKFELSWSPIMKLWFWTAYLRCKDITEGSSTYSDLAGHWINNK